MSDYELRVVRAYREGCRWALANPRTFTRRELDEAAQYLVETDGLLPDEEESDGQDAG